MGEGNSINATPGKRSGAIDALRTLSMIAVVFIHVVFPGTAGKAIGALAAFAVPVFFMISGYFLHGMDVQALLRRARKTLYLTITVTVVYLLYMIATAGADKVLADVSLVSIGKWLILSAPACGLPVHLWYLYALMLCYLVFAFLLKLKWMDKVSRFLPFLIGGTILAGVVFPEMGVMALHETLYRNAFFMGVPFMALGYEFRKGEKLSRRGKWICVGIAVAGALIALLEGQLYRTATFRIGSTCFTSVALFALAVNSHHGYGWIARVGRKYSRDVYIWHVLIAGVLRKLFSAFGVYGYMAVKWAFPFIVLLVSLGVAVVISYISGACGRRKLQKQQEGEV